MANLTHPELSNIKGTLSFTLRNEMENFNKDLSDPKVSTLEFKTKIVQIINGINTKSEKSKATKRLIDNIMKQNSKTEVMFTICNSILSGDNQYVI